MPQTNGIGAVRTRLHDLVAPLLKEREQLDARIAELRAEAIELAKAKADVEAVLRRLDPSVLPPNPRQNAKGKIQFKVKPNEALTTQVQEHLLAHPDEFPDGFTGAEVARSVNANGHVMGSDRVRLALHELRERDVIRLDRRGRGGALIYKLVGHG